MTPMSYEQSVALDDAVIAVLEAGETPADIVDQVEGTIEDWIADNEEA